MATPPRDIEDQLAQLCDDAKAAWPEIAVDTAAVVDAFVAKLAGEEPPAITSGNVAELYLAVACARGNEKAIAVFERDYLSVVAQALGGMRLPAATVDDVRSIVRDKLLLADGDKPARILDYAGRGRLRGLIQVSASRAAIDRIRHEQREAELPADAQLAAAGNLELSLIKAQYREAFVAGFTTAVGRLPRRDRNLLRLHLLGGVTLEQLAQMYGVHRATVVRWLAAARAALFETTRDHVAAKLGAPEEELDQMFELVRSRVELSVERLLASVETSARHT
jgi:RNA polymerase sigma-70 factor (ECF subfamily)